VYAGDANFSSSTSAVLKRRLWRGFLSISVLPGAAVVYTGEAAAMTVGVTACKVQPAARAQLYRVAANTTCSIGPASLPNGQGAANLVIQTAAPHKAEAGFVSALRQCLERSRCSCWPEARRRRSFLADCLPCCSRLPLGWERPDAVAIRFLRYSTGTYQIAVTAARRNWHGAHGIQLKSH